MKILRAIWGEADRLVSYLYRRFIHKDSPVSCQDCGTPLGWMAADGPPDWLCAECSPLGRVSDVESSFAPAKLSRS